MRADKKVIRLVPMAHEDKKLRTDSGILFGWQGRLESRFWPGIAQDFAEEEEMAQERRRHEDHRDPDMREAENQGIRRIVVEDPEGAGSRKDADGHDIE